MRAFFRVLSLGLLAGVAWGWTDVGFASNTKGHDDHHHDHEKKKGEKNKSDKKAKKHDHHAHENEKGKKHKGHKGHQHGRGKFSVALEGQTLQVELEIPAESVVGFEHQPRNKKQRDAIAKAVKLFQKPSGVFVVNAEAGCATQSEAKISSKLLSQEGHHEEEDHSHDHEEHADFEVTYQLSCKKPEMVKSVSVKLFQLFPGLSRVDAVGLTSKGQSSARLSSKSAEFKLK